MDIYVSAFNSQIQGSLGIPSTRAVACLPVPTAWFQSMFEVKSGKYYVHSTNLSSLNLAYASLAASEGGSGGQVNALNMFVYNDAMRFLAYCLTGSFNESVFSNLDDVQQDIIAQGTAAIFEIQNVVNQVDSVQGTLNLLVDDAGAKYLGEDNHSAQNLCREVYNQLPLNRRNDGFLLQSGDRIRFHLEVSFSQDISVVYDLKFVLN